MKIKRILVPVDFSDGSQRALDEAIALARVFGAEIAVLFVAEPANFVMPGELSIHLGLMLEEQQRSGREQLARLAQRLAQRRVACRTLMRTGTAYSGIVAEAKRQEADLIVIATHGRTGFSHLLMGSVAERVVRGAPCPVLTVRAQPTGGRNSQKREKPPRSRPESSSPAASRTAERRIGRRHTS